MDSHTSEEVYLEEKDSPQGQAPRAKRIYSLIFACIFLLACLAPFAGLAWVPAKTVSNESDLSALPELTLADGTANLSFLSEAGSYFEDHFAFRNEMLDLNARLSVGLLATSPTNQVIVGEEGWLFYGGTLSDYLGTSPLSEREIVNIVHNLEIMQGYTEAQGATFVFAIAPNKNSLYPEFMPYYLLEGTDDSMGRLLEALEEKGINAVDLFTLFNRESEELYYKTDSHWNNEGALLVSNALLQAANRETAQVAKEPEPARILGDLEAMLYPVSAEEEDSKLLETGQWTYDEGSATVEDSSLLTSGTGQGNLLMFRDSFANSLIPLMSPMFEQAHYSKMIPYNLTLTQSLQADVVVIERAERHIDLLGEEAPLMIAPTVALATQGEEESESFLDWYQDEDFRVVEGWVDASLMDTETQIFIEIEGPSYDGKVFVPFYVTYTGARGDQQTTDDLITNEGESAEDESSRVQTPYGFRFYLDEQLLTEGSYTLRVLISGEEENDLRTIYTQTLQR